MGNPAKYCLFGGSTFLVTIGGLMVALWPAINDKILLSQLSLSPTSTSFSLWKITPIPMYIDFHLYNWTNPHEIKNLSTKPIFTEMGPYVFSEVHEKVNISWKAGDLIEFHQIRTWQFEPNLSNGSLDDLVTNVNVIPASASYMMRFSPALILDMMDKLFRLEKTKISVTKTVRELLFDGYEDPILNLINTINSSLVPQIPFDKFGWFYGRNGSWQYDGKFEMHTGVKDLSLLGMMTKWNDVTQTKYYYSYCAMVNGTTGELWPPANSTDDITLFAPDLCRSMKLEYSGTATKRDVPGNYYTGGKHLLDNGELYPDNKCFCGSDDHEASCLPTGVTNVSLCRYGAPAFVSYPHFYLADESYTTGIDGPPADGDKDMFSITLEPKTGIPLDVEAKLQINILLQPFKEISMYRGIPTVFMPAIRFNQHASITPKMASKLQLLLSLPTIGFAVFYSMIGIGLAIFFLGLYMSIWGRWSKPSLHSDETTLIDDEVVPHSD